MIYQNRLQAFFKFIPFQWSIQRSLYKLCDNSFIGSSDSIDLIVLLTTTAYSLLTSLFFVTKSRFFLNLVFLSKTMFRLIINSRFFQTNIPLISYMISFFKIVHFNLEEIAKNFIGLYSLYLFLLVCLSFFLISL